MEFTTKIPIPPEEPKIDYGSNILLLGSCFVENIGCKLRYFKFQTVQNPFGILFHPAAIANFLQNVRDQKCFTEADIFFHNERWHYFGAHSALSDLDKEKLLDNLNAAINTTGAFLKKASHVIITLGTAWSYRHKASGETVANCHKVAQREFSKELMEVGPPLRSIIEIIKALNPGATVIFTVSPVRHLKDGFIENQQSKARLITAVADLKASEAGVKYFPAYELMMDELRDYRFYAEDMIHPNETAIAYIWERFVQTWISSEILPVMQEVEQITKGLLHRPFNPFSEAHSRFLEKLGQRIEQLEKIYPGIRFDPV